MLGWSQVMEMRKMLLTKPATQTTLELAPRNSRKVLSARLGANRCRFQAALYAKYDAIFWEWLNRYLLRILSSKIKRS